MFDYIFQNLWPEFNNMLGKNRKYRSDKVWNVSKINFNLTFNLNYFKSMVSLGKIRLVKIRLGKIRLGKIRLGKIRLGKIRLGND